MLGINKHVGEVRVNVFTLMKMYMDAWDGRYITAICIMELYTAVLSAVIAERWSRIR